ncbi:HNH endonuclease [Chromobacterium piscinae]|uniref:HNH endonuclease n=1 Tax=Chromobacterium piscinae TaxID=686831 RepID=UPI001E64D080|nr:HNH endonuclease [Chromobacterium piscinae]MCD5329372.1 HNH endonuclease [Chromobacterium piscinae]
MKFLQTALNGYKTNQYKRRKILKKTAVNYYLLAKSNVTGLWATMYNDAPYGRKLYDAITQQVSNSSSRCAYCQDKVFHGANLNIDHILPASIYPQFTFTKANLVVACVTCNALKSDRDYYTLQNPGRYYPNSSNNWQCFHPVHHVYAEHIDRFVIQTNHIHLRAYIGKTSAGVAICTNLLVNVSEFEAKAVANPNVAQAINNLNTYMAKHCPNKTQALKNLISAMTTNI